MATLSYDSLIPYLLLDVSGAPDTVIAAMINLAARDLCIQSSCWSDVESIPLIADESDYNASPPSSGAVVREIRQVFLDDREIFPESMENINYLKPSLVNESGTPTCFVMLKDATFRLMPKPSVNEAGRSIRVTSIFVPSLNATAFDSDLIERYSDTLLAGAKYRLLEMPNKPWSNPALAASYQAKFIDGIGRARVDVAIGMVNSTMNVKKRAFGVSA